MYIVFFRNKPVSECEFILYLKTMYIYCVYLALFKYSKQLPNCLKIAETSVVQNIILLLNAIFLKFYRNSGRIDYFHGDLGFDNLIFRKSV
jgi:hypothetical protein